MDFLDRSLAWFLALGPLGLFLAAVLDAFVPLTQVVDPMVIYLSYTRNDPVTYALVATVGSVIGWSLLFLAVRKGGDVVAERWLRPGLRAKVERALARYGLAAIMIGGVMPPPFPMKGLVVVAGLGHMSLVTFATGFGLARLFRYGLESTFAVLYGEAAVVMMKRYYPVIGVALVALLALSWLLSRKLMNQAETDAASDKTPCGSC